MATVVAYEVQQSSPNAARRGVGRTSLGSGSVTVVGMRLENLVWDARDPGRLGTFWSEALGATKITEEPGICEVRLDLGDELFLDLCFQHVAAPSTSPQRLHPDLTGGARQTEIVERLLGLGAEHADIGQGDVPWVVLADPEGNTFCVMEDRDVYRGTGPIAALPLDSADPERDAAFWAEITGWVPCDGVSPVSLRHPSGNGPLLEFCPEKEPVAGKNRIHLDVRPERADGDLVARALATGAGKVSVEWAVGQPWTVLTDPSGNEFCVLPPDPSTDAS